jgi:hypothetical protein
MSLNGIAHLATKQLKQEGKLDIAEAKRQGKTVAGNGTISGSYDSTKPYWRYLNTLDMTLLPTVYSGNNVVDNAAPLQDGRPWKEPLG